MDLNQLKDNQGARKGRTRVGRGIGSGKGKTAGRGHKGQKSRGSGKVAVGFEGGQNPLYRRLPMRGFNNCLFTTNYVTLNVGQLQTMVDAGKISEGQTVSINTLQEIGFTKKAKDGLKVLGTGELKTKLVIDAAAASASALEKVKKAGGELNLPAAK